MEITEAESSEMNIIYDAVEGAGALLGENPVLTQSVASYTSTGMESMTGGGKYIYCCIPTSSLFLFFT